jgi:uncharacterized UPF0146 family protein
VSDSRHRAVVARLAEYETLVEVGIGRRPAVAAALAEGGCAVTATDVHDREVPPGVTFVRDDVTDPAADVYADADALYALHCPPELHRPIADRAREADADFLFTTLGGDPPVIPVSRETLPEATLFVAAGRRDGG